MSFRNAGMKVSSCFPLFMMNWVKCLMDVASYITSSAIRGLLDYIYSLLWGHIKQDKEQFMLVFLV